MFIQFIKAKVKDEQGLRSTMDRWDSELKPGADGYLGSTAGITGDGTFIALARFESEQAARRNSERPEQGQWWSRWPSIFEGPASSSTAPTWRSGSTAVPMTPASSR